MNRFRAAVIAAALVLAALPARAQQGPMGGQYQYDEEQGPGTAPGGGALSPRERRDEIRKKIEAVRMWRLTEELRLDEKTSARLASFLSALEEQRRGIVREQAQSMQSIRAALRAGNPDERTLKADLDRIERNHRAMMELRDRELGGLRDMLTVEQQARYLVFQQDFRREMSGLIAGARGRGPGMRGPGGGMGAGPGGPRPFSGQ